LTTLTVEPELIDISVPLVDESGGAGPAGGDGDLGAVIADSAEIDDTGASRAVQYFAEAVVSVLVFREQAGAHIRDILCGGVASIFDYVLDWCANLVQHPERQGNVVIVLTGLEGAGKAILAKLLVRMFGRHAVAINSPQHLRAC